MEKLSSFRGKLSWQKITYFVICLAVSVFFAWQFQPKYHGNSNALSVLVTVFSILAGFLVAVMAIVGSERALKGSNWRQDTFYLVRVKQDLQRHSLLFYLYLVVLALSFLAALDLAWAKAVQTSLEGILLFLACLAMMLSFSLPGQLTKRHVSALEAAIKARREKEAGEASDASERKGD